MAQKKERLDKLLVARGLADTRSRAQALIMAGEVLVEGKRVDKAGTRIAVDAVLEVLEPLPYVSRGGFKLAGALETFAIDVSGQICADVGACTGGFTDVLLQAGAARVYAIDVGYGQLAWKLRQDERVEVLERTNARYLEGLPEPVNIVVIDVSFISLRLILPTVRQWLAPAAEIVALIKPQFEAGKDQVGKGGIIKDKAVHRDVLERTLTWAKGEGLSPAGLIRSPIEGGSGNVEFLVWLRPGQETAFETSRAIEEAIEE